MVCKIDFVSEGHGDVCFGIQRCLPRGCLAGLRPTAHGLPARLNVVNLAAQRPQPVQPGQRHMPRRE